ncbi:hypothetical protein D4764_18G0007350 [Takifugu flavidus]|uniref:Uncharacterized protein n=1 Tax=Takifugu flavidus TaxID=433684 RepID=A0A5C6NTF0_9TELE|nr:hypothetical protein D4764_18G0007350 [Takifugu flavidus]
MRGLQQQRATPAAPPAAIDGNVKLTKLDKSLSSLDFSCGIQMVGSEFGLNNMTAWVHPALDQRFRRRVVVKWCVSPADPSSDGECSTSQSCFLEHDASGHHSHQILIQSSTFGMESIDVPRSHRVDMDRTARSIPNTLVNVEELRPF